MVFRRAPGTLKLPVAPLSYHPVLADSGKIIENLQPFRVLLVGGTVPDEIAAAHDTRQVAANPADLPTGVYCFDEGAGRAVLIVSAGGVPGPASIAHWDAPDDDPLINAFGWLEHLWDIGTVVSHPLFRIGDEARTVPNGEEVRIRRRQYLGGAWRYDVRLGGRTITLAESQLAEPQIDDDPLVWIGRDPSEPRAFAATLTRAKLADQLSDTVYSFRASRTIFRPYQFRPVIRLMEAERLRLLIADEVGLGKTIEAGLVWTELDARSQAGRVLVVCPSMLVEKWKTEMEDRFGYLLTTLDQPGLAEFLRKLDTDRLPERFHAICSVERLRSWSGLAELAEIGPRFDLIIVDEAHVFRNPETRSHALGSLLADWADALVLLSATPLNLGNEDLYTLLNLLAPGDFDDPYVFEQRLQPNAVLNRIRASLLDRSVTNETRRSWLTAVHDMAFGPAVEARYQFEELSELLDSHTLTHGDVVKARQLLSRLHALSGAITRTKKAEILEGKTVRDAQAVPVLWAPAEAIFYAEFDSWQREQARRRGFPVGFVTQMPLRLASTCLPAARDLLLERDWGVSEPGFDDDEADGELLADDDEVPDNRSDDELLPPPRSLLDAASALGDVDTKFDALAETLLPIIRSGKRVLLFTFSRRALSYLERRLSPMLRLGVLHGGVGHQARHEVIRRFRANGLDLVIATRVASEGLDFEFCSAVMNYDLPWNPMEVEQRIGRIDRIGQTEDKILVVNFHTPGTIETDIIERVHQRIGVFTNSIGELEPILQSCGSQLRKAMFDFTLTREEQERRLDQTLSAIEEQSLAQKEVEDATAFLSSTDQVEIAGLEQDLLSSGRYIGQLELARLLEDWARTDQNAACSLTKDGLRLQLRGTIALAAQLHEVQAAGERSADEIDRLVRAFRNEQEVTLCLDQELARISGETLLTSTHPFVRAALRTPGNYIARYSEIGCESGKAEPGRYLVLFAVARWRGIQPANELWAASVDMIGRDSGTGVGDAVLAALAEARLGPEDELGRDRAVAERLPGELVHRLQGILMERLDRDVERRKKENFSLITTRRISLEETYSRKVKQIRKSIQTMRSRGKTGSIHLHEAQLRKQADRLAEAQAKLDRLADGSMELEYLAVCEVSIRRGMEGGTGRTG